MKITFTKDVLPTKGAIAAGVLDGGALTPSATVLDGETGGALARAIKAAGFKGGHGQTLDVYAPGGDIDRVILFGLGKAEQLTTLKAEDLGGALYAAATKESALAIMADRPDGCPLDAAELAAAIAFGGRLRSYRFDKYRTTEKDDAKPKLKKLSIHTAEAGAARKAHQPLEALAEGVFWTRDLVSEPANVIYPESLAKQLEGLAEAGVEVTVLDKKGMKKLGMGALLGVAQGSDNDPRLVAMVYHGAKDKKAAPIALVGKGVTFDSGGISIKPAAGMEDMKWDMGGAAVVAGTMKALAGRQARVNVVGVVGLVENMPSGTAQRPGDIVTSLSGQTIEVLNTDAEGRLVLADVLTYTQDTYKPKAIVDLATLTGAILISLGSHYAGLFSNSDELADFVTASGKAVGEPCWRLPMGEEYDKLLKSDAADMKNIGGREGGSITAAQFLGRFIKDKTPWVHLDIAGVTWSKADKPTVPKGGTAFGVRLLDRLLAEHYED